MSARSHSGSSFAKSAMEGRPYAAVKKITLSPLVRRGLG
jgi:hypothetical protein